MERFREDAELLRGAYHSLLKGEDTDEAEAAAGHLSTTLHLITQYLTAPK